MERSINPKLVVIGILVLAMLIPVLVWSLQGSAMHDDFVQSLRSGSASLPVDLRGKKWTEAELATVEVLKLPSSVGREQALSRGLHDRGRVVVSPLQFEYQGTVTDEATGIVHVFGYARKGTAGWRWVSVHPSSVERHIERRVQQLEEAKRQWEAKEKEAGGGEEG